MPRRASKRPSAVDLGEDELRLSWRDGLEGRYPLEALRRECPCAACRALREEPGVSAPAPAPGELSLIDPVAETATARASGLERVGRYGIRILWADGHSYGIYTFEELYRRAAEEG